VNVLCSAIPNMLHGDHSCGGELATAYLRLVGPSRQRRWSSPDDQVKSEEALRIEVCDELVASDMLHARARTWPSELPQRRTTSPAMNQKRFDEGLDINPAVGLKLGAIPVRAGLPTADREHQEMRSIPRARSGQGWRSPDLVGTVWPSHGPGPPPHLQRLNQIAVPGTAGQPT